VLLDEILKLSIPEKLKLMDALWEDLSDTPSEVVLPEWHREELERTAERRKAGLEEPLSIEEARHRLLHRQHGA